MAPHYRDLIVWRRSMELARVVHLIAARVGASGDDRAEPLPELLRAAALGVPARLAAGHGSEQLERYIRAVDAAQGRVARAECLLALADDLGLVDAADPDLARARELCTDIARLLGTLHTSLRLRDQARPAE